MPSKQILAQNQRIECITPTTWVLGADIAKEWHVSQAMTFRGTLRGGPSSTSFAKILITRIVADLPETLHSYRRPKSLRLILESRIPKNCWV